jgi:hypothetical protein
MWSSKRILIIFLLLLVSVAGTAHAQPEYAKWGKKAMEVTQAKYPNAMITDYKHLGRTSLNADTLQESFKLQLQERNTIYYVTVKIAFNKQSEKITNITFEKSLQ